MLSMTHLQALAANGRTITQAIPGDPALGPFSDLPGTWANLPDLPGRGWNMIALPFTQMGPNFRLLLNQYNETLTFNTLDTGVPNRGAAIAIPFDSDQRVVALQYIQNIQQIVSVDSPVAPSTPTNNPHGPSPANGAIHHEPGLFLHMANQADGGIDIARLATVPHGDAVLALGMSHDPSILPGKIDLTDKALLDLFSPLPIGGGAQDISANSYLEPYRQFHDAPFENLFDPTNPLALLAAAVSGLNIVATRTIQFNTQITTGGIHNIPFVTRQANTTSMVARLWIHQLAENDANGRPKFVLQYAQKVMLEFFPRFDGVPGLIQWPHISINTMNLVAR